MNTLNRSSTLKSVKQVNIPKIPDKWSLSRSMSNESENSLISSNSDKKSDISDAKILMTQSSFMSGFTESFYSISDRSDFELNSDISSDQQTIFVRIE